MAKEGFKYINGGGAVEGVPADVWQGGVWETDKGTVYVKTELQRLRPWDELESRSEVRQGDLVPVKLHPQEVSRVTLPESVEQVTMGLEVEFSVIDAVTGELVDLCGGDKVFTVHSDGQVEMEETGKDWLLDELGLSPEAIRYIGEMNVEPSQSWDEAHTNILKALVPIAQACREHNVLLLPTGLAGEPLEKSWENICPHPYISWNHKFGVHESALDLDIACIQSHVDLKDFGSGAEYGLFVGNLYNRMLASMFTAVSTSGPFLNGEITSLYSNREAKRQTLSPSGGVLPIDIPTDIIGQHFNLGVELSLQNRIPVPERAGYKDHNDGISAHNDNRTKYSTGTEEFGAADAHPNIDFWISKMIITRQFVYRIAEAIKNNERLPHVLQPTTPETRISNRQQAIEQGNKALFKTSNGTKDQDQLWSEFFNWLRQTQSLDPDLVRAEYTIYKMLDQTPLYSDDYQDVKSDRYMRGNTSVILNQVAMLTSGNSLSKIRKANLELAQGFMEDIDRRLTT